MINIVRTHNYSYLSTLSFLNKPYSCSGTITSCKLNELENLSASDSIYDWFDTYKTGGNLYYLKYKKYKEKYLKLKFKKYYINDNLYI